MYKSTKELKAEAMRVIVGTLQEAEMRQGCTDYTPYAETLLKQLEPLIFRYAPLPESIQYALNSGDGTYRPQEGKMTYHGNPVWNRTETEEQIKIALEYWENKYQKACEDTHIADEMVHKLKKQLEQLEKK